MLGTAQVTPREARNATLSRDTSTGIQNLGWIDGTFLVGGFHIVLRAYGRRITAGCYPYRLEKSSVAK
jgi:hypothetical protein